MICTKVESAFLRHCFGQFHPDLSGIFVFCLPRNFWDRALFEVGYYSKMGYYFFKICENGALFEVGYYSKMGYYSSKYGTCCHFVVFTFSKGGLSSSSTQLHIAQNWRDENSLSDWRLLFRRVDKEKCVFHLHLRRYPWKG